MEVTPEILQKILNRPLFKGVIVSGSMDPVIKVGESIVVEVKSAKLNRFDIILFHRDQKLHCHYLWSLNKVVKPLLLQTRNMKGGLDLPINESEYIGKVISHKIGFWRKLRILLQR